MIDLLRFALYVLLLVAVVLGTALLEPAWANDLSLANWTLNDSLFAEQKRCAYLTTASRVYKLNLEKKNRIVRNLLDGRTTLFEAAAAFHVLNQEVRMQLGYRDIFGCLAAEAECRQVIDWVRAEFQGTGPLVSRLEDELRLHKERNGAVILPEAAPGS